MKIGPCVCNVKQLHKHVIAAGYDKVMPRPLYKIGKFILHTYIHMSKVYTQFTVHSTPSVSCWCRSSWQPATVNTADHEWVAVGPRAQCS